MKILVYVPSVSPRVKYAFRILFRSCLKAEYTLTSRREAYLAAGGPRVNYSLAPLAEGELWLPAGPLLWEEGIGAQNIELFHLQGLPAFFQMAAEEATFPFDLPALAFYLASRYEEPLAQAPRADLSIFGLPLQPDLAFTQKITRLVDASCVFVRDSGDESALA